MISPSNYITHTSSVLTAIISLIIAVSVPVGYFIITYQYMKGTINAEIELSAESIEGLVVNNPNSWQFEEIRLQEILEHRLDHDNREKRVIRDMQGQIIAQTREPLKNPVLTFSHPIYDSGTQMAQLEIRRSISPLIAQTAIISAGSVLSGIMIFLIFRSFPLRAVREAYNTMEENEKRLTLALTSGNFGVWDWDIKKNVMIWDDRMYEIYGVSRDSVKVVIEAWQNGIYLEDRDRVLEDVRTGILGGRVYNTEFRIVQPDGTVRYIKAEGLVIRDADGEPSRMISLIHDITERKQAEEKIRESLLEKETMLKEIHHRVKNNLQVISSLLNMQSSYLKDEKAREALWESMARVRTMAMIHTQLYQSQDLARVDFGLFIRDLIGNISQSSRRTASPVEINIDANEIGLGIDTSIPCGLILNELVTNALKHAFPEGKEGEINIRMRSEDNQVVLTVQDNGIGFPEAVDFQNTKSLGLQLVNILVRQMNGKTDMHVDGGTTWTITFSVKNEREWRNG